MKPLPWHSTLWKQLIARREAMPHALLLRGPRGVGKRHLGLALAHALLCRTPAGDGTACGRCPSCHWMGGGNHPDFRIVQPEAAEVPDGDTPETTAASAKRPSKLIRVEQARSLQDWLSVGSHQGGWRVALLHPAEAMNPATANALLKTLEEPPPRTVLVLASNEAARLLPTIRSRCQAITLGLPTREASTAWLTEQGVSEPARALALFGGAPLVAIERAELVPTAYDLAGEWSQPDIDSVALAQRYQGLALTDVIDLLQKWTIDLANTIAGVPLRYYPGALSFFDRARRGVALADVVRLHRRLIDARRVAEHPLAPRLVMEELFIELANLRT